MPGMDFINSGRPTLTHNRRPPGGRMGKSPAVILTRPEYPTVVRVLPLKITVRDAILDLQYLHSNYN